MSKFSREAQTAVETDAHTRELSNRQALLRAVGATALTLLVVYGAAQGAENVIDHFKHADAPQTDVQNPGTTNNN